VRARPSLLTFLSLLAFAANAAAASRARYGGTLKVAVVAPSLEGDPLLADTPAEAALAQATASGLCRLDAQGRVVPVLAQELSYPTPRVLKLVLRPAPRLPGGAPLLPRDIAASLARAKASAYRALLAPLRLEGGKLAVGSVTSASLELPLEYPFPDLDRALCAPALATVTARPGAPPVGLGPFAAGAALGTFDAQPLHPEGRPFAEHLSVTASDERGAARLFALEHAQVVLGAPPLPGARAEVGGPALYATYLLFQAAQPGGAQLRQALESAVDRADLTRSFARPPSVPMHGLLPPALLPQEPLPRTQAPPSPSPPRELRLLYDAQSPDQRAVAERLQVKLHDRGYRISLEGLPRPRLRARLAARDFELMLHGLLLPPVPSLALALLLDAAGRTDLLTPELSAIGALPDAPARDARARERAAALAPSLSLVPLYAQGLSVQSSPQVSGLLRDGQGLPSLADAFLGAPP
jgi:peptide/nickel transport system substrate-binding protein